MGASGESLAAPAQVRLRGHIPQAAVAQAQLVSRVSSTEKINLALTLPLRDSVGLDTLLDRVYDPKDPLYRHYLTSEEFTRRFGPMDKVASIREVQAGLGYWVYAYQAVTLIVPHTGN